MRVFIGALLLLMWDNHCFVSSNPGRETPFTSDQVLSGLRFISTGNLARSMRLASPQAFPLLQSPIMYVPQYEPLSPKDLEKDHTSPSLP